jgi:hypothetical protein
MLIHSDPFPSDKGLQRHGTRSGPMSIIKPRLKRPATRNVPWPVCRRFNCKLGYPVSSLAHDCPRGSLSLSFGNFGVHHFRHIHSENYKNKSQHWGTNGNQLLFLLERDTFHRPRRPKCTSPSSTGPTRQDCRECFRPGTSSTRSLFRSENTSIDMGR